MEEIEVGSVVLLGSQRIRATVTYYDLDDAPVRVDIDGIDDNEYSQHWFRISDVVEVIKPPKPMPEFQEGDRVRFRFSAALYPVGHLQSPYNAHMLNTMREIWRLTAPDTLTKIWERKP